MSKDASFGMRLTVADTQHYVECGALHLISGDRTLAVMNLVPLINGKSLDVNSWTRRGNSVIGAVRGNGGAVHLSARGGNLIYEVQGKFEELDSITYFQSTALDATHYHGFVSDWADRQFDITEEADIVASNSVEIETPVQKKHASWMMAPSPRDIAFLSGREWWGITIPGMLPIGETHLTVRRRKLSIEFRHYNATNTNGHLPTAHIALNLASPYDILDVNLAACRERKEVGERKHQHEWWSRPIFCTFGEQCQLEGKGENSPLKAENVRRWTALLREKTGVNDFTVIIDAPWHDKNGDFIASAARFGGTAGMRALIDELHELGHKVLLWFTPFQINLDSDIALTVPDCLLEDHEGVPLKLKENVGFRDFTAVAARNTLQNNVRYILSSDDNCLNADGMKIDFNYRSPHPRTARLQNPRWAYGEEYWPRVLASIHRNAHTIKPDCLLTTSGVMPYLTPHTDMLRLNDLFDEVPAYWFRRARLALSLMPDTLIDADGWEMTRQRYPIVWMTAPVFAVPDMYHVTMFDHKDKLTEEDYRRLASTWHVYLNSPVSTDMKIIIDPDTATYRRIHQIGPLEGHPAAISFEHCCLATFSDTCARATATKEIEVALPMPRTPQSVQAVNHDGSRYDYPAEVTEHEVRLTVPDGASEVRYVEITY